MATESEPLLNDQQQIQLHRGLNSRYLDSIPTENVQIKASLFSAPSPAVAILERSSPFLRLLLASWFLLEVTLSLPYVFLPAEVLL